MSELHRIVKFGFTWIRNSNSWAIKFIPINWVSRKLAWNDIEESNLISTYYMLMWLWAKDLASWANIWC